MFSGKGSQSKPNDGDPARSNRKDGRIRNYTRLLYPRTPDFHLPNPLRSKLARAFLIGTLAALIGLFWFGGASPVSAQGVRCPGGGSDPTPTAVTVTALPIVVTSTVADYFVLYVQHDLNAGITLELPVSVTLGEAGTTTLAENVAALPSERYRVEKYLVADPGDVDGDCIDDLTELADIGAMDPVNPAAAIANKHGTVAIPDLDEFQRLSYQGQNIGSDPHLFNLEFVKFWLLDMNTDNPRVYFINTQRHRYHSWFWYATLFSYDNRMKGEIVSHPNLVAPDGTMGVYRFEFLPDDNYSFKAVDYAYTALTASMPFLENNLAYYPMPPRALRRYHTEQALYDASRMNVLLEEDVYPDVDFIPLNLGEGYGFLRVMDPEERPNPRDVVIYEALPNDLPHVAGIISTVPQTPLSHVNLRAIQDGVPNAFIRDALDEPGIDDLVDSHIRYTVSESGWDLRAATRAEVDAHYESSRPATAQTPERDLSATEITSLSEVDFDDWTAFGVKAANVALLGPWAFRQAPSPSAAPCLSAAPSPTGSQCLSPSTTGS